MTNIFSLLKSKFFKSEMTFGLDNIKVSISIENNGIRLTTERENWFIPNQTLDETKAILEKNFKIIKDHYVEKGVALISQPDLNDVCLRIALRFFQMYNHWRTMYTREANRDLTFLQKDFGDTQTTHTIIDYFQSKYPDNYEEKCEVMSGMSNAQLREAVVRKYQYDTK